jgi:fructose-1,6-bisphosphatase/inositol monophosphatase family enzyme
MDTLKEADVAAANLVIKRAGAVFKQWTSKPGKQEY